MKKHLQTLTVLAASIFSINAYAGMTTDHEGNVGYDTAQECDAAVHNGTAKFYQPFTHKPALKRQGEKTVVQATLRDLGPQYQYGACDVGVGRSHGREGVTRALQGKFVPFSPDMSINVYSDASGKAVRASMGQCDNNFSGNAPRPVSAPVVQSKTIEEPAPVVVVEPVEEKASSGIRPYLFGTVGALQDGVKLSDAQTGVSHGLLNDRDARVAGQVGLGVQFNNIVGLEAFYQGAAKHKYNHIDGVGTVAGDEVRARNKTYGARITLGSDIGDNLRLFGKLGVASVRHSVSDESGEQFVRHRKARPTAGVGMLYKLNDNIAVRADYDHYFRKKSTIEDVNVKWRGANYLGAGIQYTF